VPGSVRLRADTSWLVLVVMLHVLPVQARLQLLLHPGLMPS
jgi:hypothetical protein